MFKKKRNSHVSIELNDYVLRALVVKGQGFEQAKVYEVELPTDVMEEASIKDEMALFEILKDHVPKWGGKKQHVRFFVPDQTILLKSFTHPTDVTTDGLKEYVEMELGESIHLPFDNPLIDVYDPTEGDGQAMMFAASSEEVGKLTHLFIDCKLTPRVADVRQLCNLRVLQQMQLVDSEKTYLIANWLVNELSICIYSNGNVDFLRYQPIPTDMSQWTARTLGEDELEFVYSGEMDDYRMIVSDQVLELDRIMNFFRFSLHKGEKAVDEIIVMGDNPILSNINSFLQNSLAVPVTIIDDAKINEFFPGFKAKHAPLLGLALKGGST